VTVVAGKFPGSPRQDNAGLPCRHLAGADDGIRHAPLQAQAFPPYNTARYRPTRTGVRPDAAWLAAMHVHDECIDSPMLLAASATVQTARRPDLPLPGLAAGAVRMPSMEQLPMKGSSQT